ncbi:MAG: ABC transporter ATP-binding protein [Clostridiales Family XIII bacterium]|jgi:simple sugar transport system ATP-binding protein|nr:ABC transporter ATP-binding protein [Clostridiales Family XIII bacterium]
MEFIIEMCGITKEFPGVVANDDVTLQLGKGEIHALLGENGAGKSTLMSVLFGLYRPEKGVIKIKGEPVKIQGPNDATRFGIGMVHQHFKLIHNFTALENIVLGVETTEKGMLRLDGARERIRELSDRYHLHVALDARISDVTVGMQQRVEILKMLYRENEILIFDEPTAVLTPQETEGLMETMRELAAEGKSILFITHKLNEIKAVADRCTVLRKGRCVAVVDVKDASKEDLSEMMVGRRVGLSIRKTEAKPGKVILEAEHVTVKSRTSGVALVNDVSFRVREGEIVCVAGIDGNGQSELVYALTGMSPIDAGSIRFEGRDITADSVRRRGIGGMAHIPEDRQKYGLVLDYDLACNLALQTYFTPRFCRAGFLKYKEIYRYAETLIDRFDIRGGRGAGTPVRGMSGGNQQKAIVAREIDRDPKLLIAVQPTRGLDVGAIEYIHRQIVAERERGKGVLLISLELSEVMDVSDRILALCAGRIVADVRPDEVNYRELGLYMSGSKTDIGEGDAFRGEA